MANEKPYDEEIMRACLYGTAVGDALGVPYEFRQRGEFTCQDMVGWGTHGQPPGTWSDDTSMSLCVCDSIRRCGRVDTDDLAASFRAWLDDGAYTCSGEVFDVGITCCRAIETGMPCTTFDSCGNGSLMRTAPVALMRGWAPDDARAVSSVTHMHQVATETCVAACTIVSLLAEGGSEAIPEVRSRYGFITALPEADIASDGYCVHTLGAALWCLCNTGSYQECVVKAVNLGDDSDTTAAVAGAMAGVAYGYDAIPERWLAMLRGKDVIDACI